MRILVACEESGRVTKAFRDKGHQAFSVDLKPTTGELPQYHIIGNVLDYLNDNWDMLIGFPPCTFFSRMNFLNYYRKGVFNQERFEKAKQYVDLFNSLWNADIPKICLENPVPFKLFVDLLPKPSMTFQPYEFGASYSKKTCLWLKGLPYLMPTFYICKRDIKPLITVDNSLCEFKTIEEQSTFRSKTFNGVALAMAEQWG